MSVLAYVDSFTQPIKRFVHVALVNLSASIEKRSVKCQKSTVTQIAQSG